MSKDVVLENAKKAKAELDRMGIDRPIPFFHIRPTSSGITLVTTHSEKAMRGIVGISASQAGELLKRASDATRADGSVDFSQVKYVKKTDKEETFPESPDTKCEKEFAIQAFVINKIVCGEKSFSAKFGVDQLFFIGSELILQEGSTENGKRIDIVAHDGYGKILFLEIKDKSNAEDDPRAQVQNYVKKYHEDAQFKELLLNYPTIPSVQQVREFEGWTLIGNCEDLNEILEIRRAI